MSVPAPDLTTADPRILLAWLRAFFAPGRGRPHWTSVSIALGRVADERLYERTEYGAAFNEEIWAKDVLGLTRGEMRLALKLYRAIGRHPAAPWAELPKPKALLLDEVLTAGGDVTQWSLKAQGSTTNDFEAQVRRQLKEDVFLTLTIRYPESMKELVEEAMRRAVYYGLSVIGDSTMTPDPGQWQEPAVRFRAFEILCAEYMTTTEPIPTTKETP